jgi:hypothetical protein
MTEIQSIKLPQIQSENFLIIINEWGFILEILDSICVNAYAK